jgi:hypothetical protein
MRITQGPDFFAVQKLLGNAAQQYAMLPTRQTLARKILNWLGQEMLARTGN